MTMLRSACSSMRRSAEWTLFPVFSPQPSEPCSLGGCQTPDSRLKGGEDQTRVFDDVPATWTYVSEDFFKTMSVPLLRGRSFTAADRPNSPSVVIVSQSMARKLWPGEDPVGKRFKYDVPGYAAKDWLTVVGVTGDTARDGPETQPDPVIYYPVRQKVWDPQVMMVRVNSDPATLEAAVANQIHQIDRTIPRIEPSTLEQQLWDMRTQRRFQTWLFAFWPWLSQPSASMLWFRTRWVSGRVRLESAWR